MQTVLNFISNYWVHAIVITGGVVVIHKFLHWLENDSIAFIKSELESLRAKINENPVASQLAIDDAIINTLQSYLPEVIHGLDETIKKELQVGKISSLDWKELGASLWAKARAEIETGTVNYMRESGEADGKIIAEIVAKKFFMKQAALQQGTIVPTHS